MTAVSSARPRTLLFVPASDARKIAKARSSSADMVILDLEDGVATAEKSLARDQAGEALRDRHSSANGLALRVNALGSAQFSADMRLIESAPPDLLIVPKVESPADVMAVVELLGAQAADCSGIAVIACLETPRGVLAASAIAAAHPLLAGLLFGSGDYCASLGIQESPGRTELDYPRAHVAMAASAAGLLAIDPPFYQGLGDLDALRADTLRGRQLGYHAKAAIHPAHLETIEEVFTPCIDEIEWAERIVTAYELGQRAGHGATRAGDLLVDEPVVAQARQILRASRKTPIS